MPEKSLAQAKKPPRLSEDWLAVIIAYALILLSVIGLLGPNGLMIKF